MRPLVVLLCATAIARAEPPPVTIAPFHNRCFDAEKLAERVRLSVPELTVRVGGTHPGAHQVVRVSPDVGGLSVQVTAKNAAGKVVGSERRAVPGGLSEDECATMLDTAALIVARAATPLHALKPAQPKPPVEAREPTPREPPPREPPPREPPREPPQVASPAPPPTEKPPPQPEPRPAPPPKREVAQAAPPPTRAEPKPPPPTNHVAAVVLPSPPPRRHAELDLAASWAFEIDTSQSAPSGELHVGYAWPRAGLILRAGVDGDWTRTLPSTAGPITLDVRRLPLGLEAHVDVRVRSSAFRFSLGPNLALWLVRASGLPRSSLHTVVEAGLTARIAYRLELGRVVLSIGVVVDTELDPHWLTVDSLQIAKTPWIQVSPYVSAGTQIF